MKKLIHGIFLILAALSLCFFAGCADGPAGTVDSEFDFGGSGGGSGDTYYHISYESDSYGYVYVEEYAVKKGKKVTIIVSPSSGYELDTLTVTKEDGSKITVSSDYTFTMPASDVTISATFKKATTTYTVTIASVSNGTVSADKTSGIAKGSTVRLTVNPSSGYELDTLTVTKQGGGTVTVTDNTFVMPDSNVTVSATFKVKTSSGNSGSVSSLDVGGASNVHGYVGKIALNDGTFVDASNLTAAQKAKAIAVIFYDGSDSGFLGKKTLGVGLKNTQEWLEWASANRADGWLTKITAIQCAYNKSDADAAGFTGDTDGSDNWEALCDAVSDENTSGNYPAWEWVNDYATTASLTGAYASGWYFPTIAELSALYRAKATVNTSLENAGGTKIADDFYWSSTQASQQNYDSQALSLDFGDGTIIVGDKYGSHSVCCIRAF